MGKPSASDLARRLDLRFGSARFHLHKLIDADIAIPAGERVDRGGTALLFRVPEGLWFDLDADAPPALNVAIRRSLVRELERRLDAAALDQRPDDTIHDVLSLRELAIRTAYRAEAEAIVEEALARLIVCTTRRRRMPNRTRSGCSVPNPATGSTSP